MVLNLSLSATAGQCRTPPQLQGGGLTDWATPRRHFAAEHSVGAQPLQHPVCAALQTELLVHSPALTSTPFNMNGGKRIKAARLTNCWKFVTFVVAAAALLIVRVGSQPS